MAASTSLTARGVTVTHGDQVVLDDVSISIGPDTRVGLVGPNGSGKTTLLRVLAGLVIPDAGRITAAPPDATVGYLPQEPDRRADETVLGFISRRAGIAEAHADLDRTTAALGNQSAGSDDAYSAALERWLSLGGADFDARSATVWSDLGMPEHLLHQPTATLSGGQAARASLASILISRFDILLLDEPTNDLDFDGLERLERFVMGVRGGMAIVSHDRAFLERTITSVVELDDRSHHATDYAGGWLAYLDLRETARRHAEEAYAVYTTRRAELTDRAREQRQWASQGVRKAKKRPRDNDKAQRDWFLNRTEKQASKVRITEKALDRLEVVDKPWEGWELRLEIATAPRSGDVVARLDGAVVERGDFRLGPVDLEIGWAERVAILGDNGSGKTTLLDALFGRIPLTEGSRWLGPGVVVGEIDQARVRLATNAPLIDAFVANTGAPLNEARSLLAKFALGAAHVTRWTATLSPGERTRAVLALLMARGVNCLVLDEPTNHLDLPAIEQLEQALGTWTGTLLLVTHDRRLLEAVAVDRTVRVRDGAVSIEATTGIREW